MHAKIFGIEPICNTEIEKPASADEIFENLHGIADYTDEIADKEPMDSTVRWIFDPKTANVTQKEMPESITGNPVPVWEVTIPAESVKTYIESCLKAARRKITEILETDSIDGYGIWTVKNYLDDEFSTYIASEDGLQTITYFLAEQYASAKKNPEKDSITFRITQVFDYHS